jgi:hypothetical protein
MFFQLLGVLMDQSIGRRFVVYSYPGILGFMCCPADQVEREHVTIHCEGTQRHCEHWMREHRNGQVA